MKFSEEYLKGLWLKLKNNSFLNPQNGCLEWNGKLEKNGYARTFYKKQRWLVHRASFVCNNFSIPPFTMICHKCHNRKCINPDHLYAGFHADNMNDMKNSNRACKGDNHPTRKFPEKVLKGEACFFSSLTKNQVIMIKELYKINPNCCFISRVVKIHRKTISDIINKKTWKCLDEDN